eukprot:1409176-Rhodomonas_salina.3
MMKTPLKLARSGGCYHCCPGPLLALRSKPNGLQRSWRVGNIELRVSELRDRVRGCNPLAVEHKPDRDSVCVHPYGDRGVWKRVWRVPVPVR